MIASGSVALGPEDKTVRVSITREGETATIDFEFKEERVNLYKAFVDTIKKITGLAVEPPVNTLADVIPAVKSEIVDQTHISFFSIELDCPEEKLWRAIGLHERSQAICAN